MKNLYIILTLALLSTGHTLTYAAAPLEAENLWVREAPPGSVVMAGYGTLRNTGDSPLVLLRARSPQFGKVEFHETTIEEDIVRMGEKLSIVFPPGEPVVFATNGLHFMLINPERRLTAGDTVHLTLFFDNAETLKLSFPVRSGSGGKD